MRKGKRTYLLSAHTQLSYELKGSKSYYLTILELYDVRTNMEHALIERTNFMQSQSQGCNGATLGKWAIGVKYQLLDLLRASFDDINRLWLIALAHTRIEVFTQKRVHAQIKHARSYSHLMF